MNKKNARLIEGSIKKTLIQLTIPNIFGGLSMVIFNLTDTYFVGQLGGNQLAALSFTFPIILLVNGFAHGIGIGVSAVVSRAIGEGNQKKVRNLTTHGLLLSFLLISLFSIAGFLTIKPLFHLMGASSEIMAYIEQYMRIWYLGVFAMIIPMVGNNAIQASGDTKTPGLMILFAAILNIILDPMLIYGIGPFPRFEIAGAAIATVISRFMMLVFSLIVLYYREKMITFTISSFQSISNSWKQILYIGLPNSGMKMILPFAAGIITRIIAAYGSTAVAGFGVATRIEFFAIIGITALSSVLSPFVGQNWGAGRFDRIRTGIKFSYQFSFLWGISAFIILGFFSRNIGLLFTDDPQIISVITLYLLVVPTGYSLYGILMMATSVMSVLKKPFHAISLILAQTFGLYIPLAFIGSSYAGLWGIFVALPISYFVLAIIAPYILNRIVIDSEERFLIANTISKIIRKQ